jgi:hypothetical protein
VFKWYHNAAKCNVYLEDVSTKNPYSVGPSLISCETAFRQSRWFTQGWTLQELLAPSSVEFFSSEWSLLGNKELLEGILRDITGIATRALEGYPLCTFTIQDRIAWARHREKKRQEDKAYCLIGIFDVNMPLLYGEGKKSAFRRLHKETLNNLSTPCKHSLHSLLAKGFCCRRRHFFYCYNCGDGPSISQIHARCLRCVHECCFECPDEIFLEN